MYAQKEDMHNKVLIYTDVLLPYSATFIAEQVGHLSKYQAAFLGSIISEPSFHKINTTEIISYDEIKKLSKLQRLYIKLTGKFPKRIETEVERFSPNLIHAHFSPDALWVLRLRKKLNIPLITTVHSPTLNFLSKIRPSYKYYLLNRDKLFQVGDYFIAVSKFIRDELLSNGCPEEKVLLHYIGVDTNYFAQDLNIHREETILYVGRLVEYKGCHDLIKAIYIVQKKVPNVKLVIIGDGKMRSYLEKCANDFKINCHFLGRQPKHIVRKWMNKAKVFCLPSFTTNDNKTEAFGMVFAEAQAMGLPVVSCRSGGIPEVVQHGITGFLTSERDHVELSYYISYLLSDSHKWQELSDNARVWVNKKFDIIKQTKILEDLYDEVILKHRLNTDTKQ